MKAIDHEASDYKTVPGTNAIMKFRRLVLQPESLGSHELARDAEYLSNLLVSDALGEHLKTLKLREVGLYKPEEMIW